MFSNSFFINSRIKSVIVNKGIKFKKVSEETGIEYQRLNRIFNQNAVMAATELMALCRFLDIDPRDFLDATDAA